MSRFGLALVGVPISLCLWIGCAKSSSEQTFLQSDDLQAAPGVSFDANEIVDPASFADATSIDATAIQRFFEHSPYRRASFLSTYQSNGLRAADAIVQAAQKYQINPLVLLVRAEIDQGLVGEQSYPQPPSRVEYAFNCGCPGVGACDPRLAGFDLQVECLARELRQSLSEIAAKGVTAGGWGPGQTQTTVDGVNVTPADASTAALYQYVPKVGRGSSGNWLFWNVWENYSAAIGYFAPSGGGAGQGAWVGDPCASDMVCTYAGGACAVTYPGGLCTATCTNGSCPTDEAHVATFCASYQQTGLCLAVCDPNAPGSCRNGYSCVKAQAFGGATAQFVCAPQ